MDIQIFNAWFKRSGLKKRHYYIAIAGWSGRTSEIEEMKNKISKQREEWDYLERAFQKEIAELKEKVKQDFQG
jgi:uncharacterized protein YeaO (DUF488 family)